MFLACKKGSYLSGSFVKTRSARNAQSFALGRVNVELQDSMYGRLLWTKMPRWDRRPFLVSDRVFWIAYRSSWIDNRGSVIVDRSSWIDDRGSVIVDR